MVQIDRSVLHQQLTITVIYSLYKYAKEIQASPDRALICAPSGIMVYTTHVQTHIHKNTLYFSKHSVCTENIGNLSSQVVSPELFSPKPFLLLHMKTLNRS